MQWLMHSENLQKQLMTFIFEKYLESQHDGWKQMEQLEQKKLTSYSNCRLL
jgi:hypothetical protein